MVEGKEEVLSVLQQYKHGFRTNLNKKVLNNRDACAFALWVMGPSKVRDIINVLKEWRGKVVSYQGGMTDLCFTYLFNASHSGGYGCVADNAFVQGVRMNRYGIVSDAGQRFVRTIPETLKEPSFFRRQYWFRSAPGIYTPTLECAKRMTELQLG